jgi:hypothetical protein
LSVRAILAVVVLVSGLAGCGKPVPAEKADYVGEWSAGSMYLAIAPGGHVEYRRQWGASRSVSVSGPIRGFRGDDFSVGFLFFATTFVVSRPPYREGDRWKMVVDGVELTRVP